MAKEKSDREKIEHAIDLGVRYGGIDGAHHKTWVIDQMLRSLMGPALYADYCKMVEEEDGVTPDCGIAP